MNTKFKVLATAALLSISLSGIAQGIVSSQTLVREVKPSEPKKRYVSYRGSIEVSGIFSSAISGAHFAIVPLGFQCSPYFYIGLGVGIQTLSLGDVDTPEEYLDGNQNKTYQGTYLDEEVTPSLFLTSKVNIPTLSFGNEKRFIPFASVSVGSTFSDEGIMGDFRIGLTYMSKKKHSGVSVFLGLSTLPFEVKHVYSYKSGKYNYTLGDYTTNRSTCFNIGLSWEFGGAAGFNKRSRK